MLTVMLDAAMLMLPSHHHQYLMGFGASLKRNAFAVIAAHYKRLVI